VHSNLVIAVDQAVRANNAAGIAAQETLKAKAADKATKEELLQKEIQFVRAEILLGNEYAQAGDSVAARREYGLAAEAIHEYALPSLKLQWRTPLGKELIALCPLVTDCRHLGKLHDLSKNI
jgi:hypothetical protein